ncbi:MAG: NAD-dependent epimerase/dehydratase family protein [Polyangiaceae bacterium]
MTALVAGCGYVGRRLAELLLADGEEVWGLRRSPVSDDTPIRWLAADLAEPLGDALAPIESDTIDLHYLVGADGFSDEAYHRAYVLGLRHLLERLDGRIRRLIFASSTAVFHQTDGGWVNEDSPTEPSGFAGRRLLEGEALAATLPSVVVRFGGIYGPGRTRLVDKIRAGEGIAPREGTAYRSRMHREDCARALRHLARLASPAPRYLGVDEAPADLREVEAWLCEQLGRDPETLAPPPPSSRGGNKRCDGARLRESGFGLDYPTYREGYTALLRELELARGGGEVTPPLTGLR